MDDDRHPDPLIRAMGGLMAPIVASMGQGLGHHILEEANRQGYEIGHSITQGISDGAAYLEHKWKDNYIGSHRKAAARQAQNRAREERKLLTALNDNDRIAPEITYNLPQSYKIRNTGNLFWWGEGNLKYHDTGGSTTVSNDDWLVRKALDIPQGTGYDKRTGLKVALKNICVRGTIRVFADWLQGKTSYETNCVSYARVYLVLDEQPNGTTADEADIFTNTTDGHYNTSHRKLENSDRFKILAQEEVAIPVTLCFHPADGSGTGVFLQGMAPFMVMLDVNYRARYADGSTAPPITNNVLVVYELDPHYTTGTITGADTYIKVVDSTRVRFTSY